MLEEIFDLKRVLIQLRRVIANTRDVVGHLLRNEFPLVKPDLAPFFRDVYDHLIRNLDLIEIHRDLLNGATELYLSQRCESDESGDEGTDYLRYDRYAGIGGHRRVWHEPETSAVCGVPIRGGSCW